VPFITARIDARENLQLVQIKGIEENESDIRKSTVQIHWFNLK